MGLESFTVISQPKERLSGRFILDDMMMQSQPLQNGTTLSAANHSILLFQTFVSYVRSSYLPSRL
jgi:hypothetical protein